MKEIFIRRFRRDPAAKTHRHLKATKAGLEHLNSKKYEDYITSLVAGHFEQDASFYVFLLGVTAGLLSESDPNAEEIDVFEEFIAENMFTIRAAIDRIRLSKPEIAVAEAMWEDARAHGQLKIG